MAQIEYKNNGKIHVLIKYSKYNDNEAAFLSALMYVLLIIQSSMIDLHINYKT